MVAIATAAPKPLLCSSPTERVAARSRTSLRRGEETGSLVYGPGSRPRDGCVTMKYGTRRDRIEIMLYCSEDRSMRINDYRIN